MHNSPKIKLKIPTKFIYKNASSHFSSNFLITNRHKKTKAKYFRPHPKKRRRHFASRTPQNIFDKAKTRGRSFRAMSRQKHANHFTNFQKIEQNFAKRKF